METLKSILFVLMIPLLGTAALLLVAGGGDGEFEDTGIVTIDHPQDLVFEWLTKPEHRKEWIEGLTSSRCDARDVEAGATLKEVVDEGDGPQDRTVEVLQAEYGALVKLRVTEPGRVYEVSYALSVHRSSRRTRIDVSTKGTLEGWWARLVEPILSARIEERIEADLVRLAEKLRGA
jgi:uncharacterized protein YndB with AHSA1/START domain